MKGSLRHSARVLVIALVAICLPVVPVHAALLGTEATLATGGAATERAHVRDFLGREDVAGILQRQGVDAAAALDRVDAMTDAEVRQLAERIDNLPAGGSVLGFLFAVFVILLVTDILGFTKVFPFTRSVR